MRRYIRRCDLARQYKKHQNGIDAAIRTVLSRGIYTLGDEVRRFEEEFARYIGCRYGVAVGSGTDAIVLALRAAGIRSGDEVITTPFAPTPVATAIALAQGIPVFADVDTTTGLIDPGHVAKKITGRTRFLLPVHLFGYVCDMKALGALARTKSITIIEDVSQAHGAALDGRKAGRFGAAAAFSFYPTKNLGGYGDGGMVVTDSARAAKRIISLRNYGKERNPFDSEIIGYNSRCDELQAAVLRVKLRYLEGMNRDRRKLVSLYETLLRDTPVKFLLPIHGSQPVYHIMSIRCGRHRDRLAASLASAGIQTNVYYPQPLYKMRAFRKFVGTSERFSAAEGLSKEILALPLYPELAMRPVERVCGIIRKYFRL